MAKLLHIESSPRKARSKSIAVSSAFLDAYRSANPNDEIVTLDLWKKQLPEFDGFTIDAKYQVMRGQDFTPEQSAAWQAVVDVADEFKSADKYVFSVPMWNFGFPYKLKHYFDVLAQPGQTFTFSPETGYTGLVTGKPVALIYARGGSYGSNETKGMDFQRGHLNLLLGFIGFTDIREIVIEPTMASPAEVEQTEQSAMRLAKELAAQL